MHKSENKTVDLPSSRWVFGYGSLIWRPGFDFVSTQKARVYGLHRALCIYSHHYRGTPAKPGLVFGLKNGGSCQGMAFEVATDRWAEVHAYLCGREQVTSVYLESTRTLRLENGGQVSALTFVVDETHAQFTGYLSEPEQARYILEAKGNAGDNIDYVLNTSDHLGRLGIKDPALSRLKNRLTQASVQS